MLYACVRLFTQQHKSSQNESEGAGVRGAGYTPIVKENARFVKYYQVMSMCVSTWVQLCMHCWFAPFTQKEDINSCFKAEVYLFIMC